MMDNAKTNATADYTSLAVVSAGLCCALGYELAAAACALRANFDHFQESSFYSLSSDPINTASLPDTIYGQARLQRWVEYAVRDCMLKLDAPESLFDGSQTAIIVLAPDETRPGIDRDFYIELPAIVMAELRQEIVTATNHPEADNTIRTSVVFEGRTGIGTALLLAASLLLNKSVQQVLLVGVDSFLDAATINHYLEEERLFVRGNSNGFIPGEAAAALLLRSASSSEPGLHIGGIGTGEESGRHDGTAPSRGIGLTQAIRTACMQSKVHPHSLAYRMGDDNGEQFFSRDSANALTRVMFGGSRPKHLTTADKLGEIGAATGLAMLAWLYQDMSAHEISPGNVGLLHLSNDNGARCAILLRQNGEK